MLRRSEYLGLLGALLRATVCDRSDPLAENLLPRHQRAVLTRPTRKRPRLRTRDRLVRVLARRARCEGRRHLVLVRPETVVGWHRRGWRLFWRWRSRARVGRPRLSAEIRELIARMARDNPAWAADVLDGPTARRAFVERGQRRPRLLRSTWSQPRGDRGGRAGSADANARAARARPGSGRR